MGKEIKDNIDRDAPHIIYKEYVKEIISHAFYCFAEDMKKGLIERKENFIISWIDNFVEHSFKTEE